MTEISRLRWLCRRGMKELDLVMTGYLENYYDDADQSEQSSFRVLLDMQDPNLFALLVGRESSNDNNITSLIDKLRSMAKKP
ncbi:MAG: succinate dehydrogenase assembly factor 2 [Gammaproteobacteria bacterium]|nr:succinate dehydrogenase assembly factor 2 [Gammaproteobacteria bacterium]